jgi:hypothetical protein
VVEEEFFAAEDGPIKILDGLTMIRFGCFIEYF